ncbi:Leucine-rich repeat [Dillenia turbinata]|uniref:Leucine-rich repeat n=1 Tax=Dillenia turbinata TaxID=194707 RepID=A0AAN8UZN6_9MAGN
MKKTSTSISIVLTLLFGYGLLAFSVQGFPVTDAIEEDKQALLAFIGNVSLSKYINWNANTSVCFSWTGVICSGDHSRVIAVRLPGIGFRGPIPENTLGRLSALQVLSLRLNEISGEFPYDFVRLKNLTAIYLQFNNFSGSLPEDFTVWKNLTIVDLSNNGFSGSIPPSIGNLTHLTALNLANNSLSGPIPDLRNPSLQQLNLANNNLSGVVPVSLRRFPNTAFLGNNVSFENATSPDQPVLPPEAQPGKKSSKLAEPAVLAIVLGSVVVGFALCAVLMIACFAKRDKGKKSVEKSTKKAEKAVKKPVSGSQDGDNRLVFFEGGNFAFDLEDLLRASAEVLGKGMFGTTYKAALEDGTTVVVKRLKEVSIGRREFEQQMENVGRMKNEYVAELRAYYYSKDEKLMVYDYFSQGSVSSLLHGKRGEDRIPLDWETRLKIAVGAARGIAYIHSESGGKLVHGNIKASNIFLNSKGYGFVSDLGLATLVSPIAPPVMRTAGYRAPEVTDTRKASHASDVYSFGVLLLELLTGKSPTHAAGGEEIVHLVRWVHSVVREEWTAEVFDVELLRYPNIEEEMVEMLQIGMACVARMPEQRPKMPDVVKRVEEIRQDGSGNRLSSESSTSAPTPPGADIAGPSTVH